MMIQLYLKLFWKENNKFLIQKKIEYLDININSTINFVQNIL